MASSKKTIEFEVPLASPAQVADLKEAITEVALPKPSSTLEARVALLEKKVQAILVLSTPTILDGKAVPRCSSGCKRLSTKTGVIDHPVDGRHTFQLCDECEPIHPFAKLPMVKLSYVEDFTGESLKKIRSLNEAIKCVPSR